MQRAIALTVIFLIFAGCDPGHRVSVAQPIAAPLGQTCVIESLRIEKSVQEAGVGATGLTYAVLIIPVQLKGPQNFTIGVEERKNDKGELEINFYRNWIGSRLDREYGAYLQTVMEGLRDRVIDKCGGG